MHHEIRVFDAVSEVAAAGADYVVEHARLAVATRGVFHFVVSGGTTPGRMFTELRAREMPWERSVIYQVDERVAPRGDAARNLTNLAAAFEGVGVVIEPLPVDDEDLRAGADRYGELLPDRLDLVHLGLGRDGHTASLVPGDPVLEEEDRLVAITREYQGHRRMTLTYRALARADQLLWLVTGSDKRAALSRLVSGDVSIPAGRVDATHSLVMADRSATWS